ncbi:Peptidase family M50 [Novipirellula aureliae]|uniref:Peptidase family M50 n=1 Tax=Novipirellula aureliae TaxID=2527966 RepID=A0A5C6E7I8_9BACT|nr:site-2 protease family protein [Novipirellula aureliae]TWU43917.1 Peptidase family M50 [Novipirellula aureliae]
MADSILPNEIRSVPSVLIRRDLRSVSVQGYARAYRMVIDDVSGKFSRISEHAWQQLHGDRVDPSLSTQAKVADWTCERLESPSNPSKPFNFLAIQIPLGSIDGIARRLAPVSGFLFSPVAILFWMSIIVASIAVLVSRSEAWVASLRLLPVYLRSANAFGIGITFLITKVLHELAHAVMCRRMGAESKSVGVYLFCGVPCPYCDVTDVWRIANPVRRAAVMLAGIYVELIIAASATWVWVLADDPAARMYAMNLILVCGISTVLFNANPLMRYDGYYVLLDAVGSTNLRREAREAFESTIIARIAGKQYQKIRRSDKIAIGLSSYHIASTIYRTTVLFAIAALIVHVANLLHLSVLGIGLVCIVAVRLMAAKTKASISVLQGKGSWMGVSKWRRFAIVSTPAVLLLLILFLPLPRYREVAGIIDAANSSSVFLPPSSQISKIKAEYGDHVAAGDRLALLTDETSRIEITRLEGELRLANMRGELARRDALDRPKVAEQWKTLQAAEESVGALLDKAKKRLAETQVHSPVSGVVIPPQATTPVDEPNQSVWLASFAGTVYDSRQPFCRIATNEERQAMFWLDAKDQRWVTRGTAIRVRIDYGQREWVDTKIESVSQMSEDRTSVTRDAVYRVICPLPTLPHEPLLDSIGRSCVGVVKLPSRSLAADFVNMLSEFVSGG